MTTDRADPFTVALVMAMRAEAEPLIEAVGLAPTPGVPDGLPFSWFSGRLGSTTLVVSLNGTDPRHGVDNIATQPAVLNTWVTCERFHPDLVISAGTAGGFEARGGRIGEVIVSSGELVYHHRRVDLPGFDAYADGRYPVHDVSALIEQVGARPGVVSTGDSLDAPPLDRQRLDSHGADAKEMEAAAVAWVCWLRSIPMIAVKAITDLVDHPAPTGEQFLANLSLATERLTDTLVALIPLLEEHR